MTEWFIGTLSGFAIAGVIFVFLLYFFRRVRPKERDRRSVTVISSLEQMKSIGELSVFKVVTKEIVTAKDHWAGEFGKKYLAWLISAKKMAMIFEFDIDFRYDLRDPQFEITREDLGTYRVKMSRCTYEIHIRDINFYDEQRSKFMPWLLPELLTAAFGAGYSEEDRNRLKEEAKHQAYSLAKELVSKLRSEVQTSARQTIEALAKGFSVQNVTVEFQEAEPEQVKVSYAVDSDEGQAAEGSSG